MIIVVKTSKAEQVVERGEVIELGGREALTTNNKMELTATLEALEYISNHGPTNESSGTITLFTDSSYVIQGISSWVKSWVKNGWITAAKEPVVNQDIWQKLVDIVESIEESYELKFEYVKGHVGIPGNERVDVIATAYADEENIKLFKGLLSDYSVDITQISQSKVKKVVDFDKKKRAAMPAYSYVSVVKGEVMSHKTWKECEARVKGVSGAKFKKALSRQEEQSLFKEYGAK